MYQVHIRKKTRKQHVEQLSITRRCTEENISCIQKRSKIDQSIID